MTKKQSQKRRIVSSRHLATSEGWQLSELEYGLIITYNGFSRWMNKCMNASGMPDLNSLEILVLHNINHREKQKKLSDKEAQFYKKVGTKEYAPEETMQ